MFELERLDEREGTSDAGRERNAHRASVYLTGTQNANDKVSFAETLYVQPRLDAARDVRILGEASITSQITKRIALSDAFIFAYDRSPPEGVKRYDTQLRVSVIVTF